MGARLEFRQKDIAAMAPGSKVQTFSDPSTPGLTLRITPSGAKTYFYVYRMGGRGSKTIWLKIGAVEAVQLVNARELARKYRAQRDEGVDPAQKIAERVTAGTTIEALAKKFEAEYLPKKSPKTATDYKGSIHSHILPALGKVEVKKLTRDQVVTWHGKIEKPIAANRALACLSVMMSQAIDVWGMRDTLNPCRKVERNQENPRLRDITTGELEALGKAIRALEGVHGLYSLAAIRVVLLCWGRMSEVLGLRRDRDVHLSEGYAVIRSHKGQRKTGAKRLELPPEAVAILEGLPETKGNPWYFPGRVKGSHLTRHGLHKTWVAVCEKAGIADLHLHDSRSLAASELEAQGYGEKTAAAILGHSDVRTAAKHYTRARRTQEVAAKISAPIGRALGEPTPKAPAKAPKTPARSDTARKRGGKG